MLVLQGRKKLGQEKWEQMGGGKRGWGSDGEDEAVVGLTSAPPPADPQSQGRAGKERGGRAGREASDGIMNTSVSPSVK